MQASPEGKFAGVERCPELDAILTATPATTSRLGNFTEFPDPSVIRDCSSSTGSAFYILDGEELAAALADPTPLPNVRSGVFIQVPGILRQYLCCCKALVRFGSGSMSSMISIKDISTR